MNNLLNLLLLSTASLSSINHATPHGRKNLAAYRDMELADAQEMTDSDMTNNETMANGMPNNTSNNAMTNNTTSNNAMGNNTASNTTMGNNTASNNTMGNNTSFNNTMGNNTSPNTTTGNNTASNTTMGNNTASNTTMGNNTASNVPSDNTALSDNIINNQTYEDASQSIPMQPIFNVEVDALLPNDLMARFVLPPLPYAYDALEPYIDAETMRTHHNRHHQTYINNLNNAIARYPELYAYTLGQLLTYSDRLPSDVQSAIINNGGGHYNHSFFWNLLSPEADPIPTGTIGSAINREFGSYSNFKRAFTAAALSVFGSGYAWLTLTPGGRLEIITTRNQDTPLPLNLIPLLTLDVWEHAYYLNYQNNRDRYIENWFNVINWPYVNSIYEAALQG